MPLSALRVVRNQDGDILYQSFPKAQQVCQSRLLGLPLMR
ncbi:hypothetical protein JCM19231_3004 [Vibrio ishigakensis]|uniref:Uncharacterized protein n=1 Tax=Vibrio ishigakensis TaxID=1481914 RepID=A0A0B8P0M5_9VIBR|nr:hypothetical protein JCM19231_3004 [Vibrio ishigakensis]